MSADKAIGRRKLLSLFAEDLRYLGNALMPSVAVNLAEAGIAKIDSYQCLAYSGQICTACHSVCPTNPKAIELKDYRYPMVNDKICNGCGECILACLAPISAITIPESPLKIYVSEDLNRK